MARKLQTCINQNFEEMDVKMQEYCIQQYMEVSICELRLLTGEKIGNTYPAHFHYYLQDLEQKANTVLLYDDHYFPFLDDLENLIRQGRKKSRNNIEDTEEWLYWSMDVFYSIRAMKHFVLRKRHGKERIYFPDRIDDLFGMEHGEQLRVLLRLLEYINVSRKYFLSSFSFRSPKT